MGTNKTLATSWRIKTILRFRHEKGIIVPMENLLIKLRDLRPDLLKGVSFENKSPFLSLWSELK